MEKQEVRSGPALDPRDAEELSKALNLAQHTVYKQYLDELSAYPLVLPGQLLLDESPQKCIRLFQLTQLTRKKGEDPFQKLSTVYHAAMSLGCSLVVMVDAPDPSAPADIYLGLRNPGEGPGRLRPSYKALKGGLLSSFPGTQISEVSASQKLDGKLNDIFGNENSCVSAVSCVAAIRDKSKTDHKSFIQGIEKLIDTMRGNTYTALLIAEPISSAELAKTRSGYESLYSALSSFRKSVWSYNESDSHSVMESLSRSISNTITEGTSHTKSHTVGRTKGSSNIFGIGIGLGLNANYSHNRFKSTSEADGTSDTSSRSEAKGETNTTMTSNTATSSEGRTLQVENVNKAIEEMLKRIEEMLKRIREEEDYGAYCCGAYFLSSRREFSLLAANTYRALMLGEGSSVERGAVNFWDAPEIVGPMKEYLRRFAQPVFALPLDEDSSACLSYSPGTVVSGLELPLHLGLPTRSVIGLPVIDHAEFGRNVSRHPDALPLGCLYHMGAVEREHTIGLDVQSLTGHTFLTGSTGTGKSNAVYHILDELGKRQVSFLVVEPAKGEYKEVLGGYPGVQVYGTNPYKTPLLRLNPFSFPEDTHVLEHIDRLVEVFNACWPMYAAMPAVLKASVELAYRKCGWSLNSSTCLGGPRRFPTFRDVMRALPAVVDSKGFSNDTQGDYKGALLTRLESMTNGINGQVLCAFEELSDEVLFDGNVIVDLSRVGSSETKALLMGVLVLKLQEHRMAQRSNGENKPNSGLRHVTVLEEAHNLLRRTSSEQSQESSNLQGKSVEMLTNAIAEMRSYGEGFIIADQSPGLLDMAVIRNTNTKLILRLPDENDRILVGKAAGLNDDQIVELSRLDTGVAAVYQNHWLEPMLCKAAHFTDARPFSYQPPASALDPLSERICAYLLSPKDARDGTWLEREGVDRVKTWIDRQETGQGVKRALYQALVERKLLSTPERDYVLYCLTHGKHLIQDVRRATATADGFQAMSDQQIAESLRISERLAQEIREIVVLYAADSIKADVPQCLELRRLGGVL